MRTLFRKRTSVLVLAGTAIGLAGLLSVGNLALADFSPTLLPTAEGYSLQWTPSTGTTHYTLVDDASCNGTTDYVQTTTVGQRDAYTVSLASIPDGSTITSIALTPCASRAGGTGGNPTMNVFYRYDGVNSADTGAYALTGTTPSNLSATTFSGLTKAKFASTTLQVGAVLTSGTKGARLSRLSTFITYTPALAAPNMTAYSSTSTPNDVQLSYSSPGATLYTIERSFTSTSSFAFLATTTNTFYTDVAPGSGKWWYRAVASTATNTSAYGTPDFEILP